MAPLCTSHHPVPFGPWVRRSVFLLAVKSWLTPLERHSMPCKRPAGYQGSSFVYLERWPGFCVAPTCVLDVSGKERL